MLELKYGPEENGGGCSAWRLARTDNQPVKLPTTYRLMRLFKKLIPEDTRGLRAIGRADNYRMLLMSTGLSKHYRESFLMMLEAQMKKRHKK